MTSQTTADISDLPSKDLLSERARSQVVLEQEDESLRSSAGNSVGDDPDTCLEHEGPSFAVIVRPDVVAVSGDNSSTPVEKKRLHIDVVILIAISVIFNCLNCLLAVHDSEVKIVISD